MRGALTADEANRFERYFLTTPERKKKLELVKLSVSGSAKPLKTAAPEDEKKTNGTIKTRRFVVETRLFIFRLVKFVGGCRRRRSFAFFINRRNLVV